MARMQKTIDKAEKTANRARDTLTTGVEETRTAAAEVLEAMSSGVRRRTRRAGRATEKTGARMGDTLERGADRVRPSRSLFGYFRRHPLRMLLLFGLMTGVVALIAVPMLANRRSAGDDLDEYGPFMT